MKERILQLAEEIRYEHANYHVSGTEAESCPACLIERIVAALARCVLAEDPPGAMSTDEVIDYLPVTTGLGWREFKLFRDWINELDELIEVSGDVADLYRALFPSDIEDDIED